jgi:hypothetical protein
MYRSRVRQNGRLQRLERCAVKVARTVLRGLGGSNAPWLPDHPTRLSRLEIGGHTRFQGVLWRSPFPAPAARVKPVRWAAKGPARHAVRSDRG